MGRAIEIKGLSKSFGRTPVLRNLDLHVERGEVLTIIGPNGSGKTTLLKVLSTLTKPDAGLVRVAGFGVARSGQSVRRAIGVVTHDPLFYDDLTGYENLKYYARLFGLGGIDRRIDGVADRLGISSRLHQRAGTMSHGTRKRFSIARALLHEPHILLMDEPESGLDQEALTRLDLIISEASPSDRTVVVTTHNLERATTLGHRMAIMSQGRIGFECSLDTLGVEAARDVYSRFANVAA